MMSYLLDHTWRLDVRPRPFGSFHLVSLFLVLLCCFALILLRKRLPRGERALRIFLTVFGLGLLFLEIGKQLCYSYNGGVWVYNWERFPFQFCSIPIYVSLIAMLPGDCRLRRALLAFLATYSPVAGASVLLYPAASVFHEIVFLNVHTMLWHGMMLLFGLYLWLSGTVKPSKKTALSAALVYLPAPFLALLLNELSYATGFAGAFDFNMFYIGRLGNCPIPLLSWVQDNCPYPVFFLSYAALLGLGGTLTTLGARCIEIINNKRRNRYEVEHRSARRRPL